MYFVFVCKFVSVQSRSRDNPEPIIFRIRYVRRKNTDHENEQILLGGAAFLTGFVDVKKSLIIFYIYAWYLRT